ncbi:MAG: hypothetical protein CVT88_09225 [Candidatus Altiarchaeales archaeon HGW-Altiarchaeales-1]|nr:MAG: hypothetical protein CVT88_09225 [Candidatus Altiarchaeales archaeon HGW-Altiarchaeales-1]
MEENQIVLSADNIKSRIWTIRDMQVMPDDDLAELYGVTTGNLNKAVTRNSYRFPNGFMFRLTKEEFKNLKFHFGISNLRSQIVTSDSQWGGRRNLPYAFTEQGGANLSDEEINKNLEKTGFKV